MDKEYEKILEMMSPYAKDVYTVTSHSPRALPAEKLAIYAKKYYPHVQPMGDVKTALQTVLNQAGEEDVVMIFGSLSFMKEIEEIRYDGTLSESCRA